MCSYEIDTIPTVPYGDNFIVAIQIKQELSNLEHFALSYGQFIEFSAECSVNFSQFSKSNCKLQEYENIRK